MVLKLIFKEKIQSIQSLRIDWPHVHCQKILFIRVKGLHVVIIVCNLRIKAMLRQSLEILFLSKMKAN